MSDVEQDAALPYLSYAGSLICVLCGRGFQRGERTEMLCGGKRSIPVISIDGESSFTEGGFTESEALFTTFDLVHRECPR